MSSSVLRSCLDFARRQSGNVRDVVRRSRAIWAQERAFERFLATVDAPGRAHGQGAAVTVVRPWWGTGEPWHMMTMALLLERRYGNALVLFDDTHMIRTDFAHPVENLAVAHALRRLPLGWHRLSEFDGADPLSEDELDKVARFDAIKSYRGDSWSTLAQKGHPERIRGELARAARRYAGFFEQVRPRYVVVSTGFQTTAGLLPRIGAKRGVRVATTDGDEGTRLMNVDGIAAHQTDIFRLMETLSPLDDWAVAQAKELFDKRTRGTDRASLQKIPPAAAPDGTVGVLLPLNQSYDTAALDRSRFFDSHGEWLVETVGWLLQNTDEPITVRQHPVERHWPGNDRYAQRLLERFGADPRIRVYDCHADVNTYDLIRRARLVLPHTSTVGIEAIAMGVPVVIEASTPYQQLLPRPASRQEYFDLIRRALTSAPALEPRQREQAWEIYFLTQICCYVPTVFTGWINDFWKWVRLPFAALGARDDVGIIVEALEQNVPLPALRYRQLQQSAQR